MQIQLSSKIPSQGWVHPKIALLLEVTPDTRRVSPDIEKNKQIYQTVLVKQGTHDRADSKKQHTGGGRTDRL